MFCPITFCCYLQSNLTVECSWLDLISFTPIADRFETMASTKWSNQTWIKIQLYTIGTVELVICVTCVIYVSCIYCKDDKKGNSPRKPISSSLKCMNLCGVIAFLLCGIVQCFNIWYWNTCCSENSFIQLVISWYGTWFLWGTGIFMTYLLFLHRIRTAFSNSTLKPSQCTLCSLYLLLTLYVIAFITMTIVLPILIFIDESYRDISWKLSLPLAMAEIPISTTMTYIFVSKLYSLILTQTVHYYDEAKESTPSLKQKSHKMSILEGKQYQRMLRITVKIAILAVVSLTSSSILMGTYLWSIAYIYFNGEYNYLMGKISAIYLQVDTMISCVCLVLFHPQTQRYFDCLCCCCSRIVSKLVHKSLQNSTLLVIQNKEEAQAVMEAEAESSELTVEMTPVDFVTRHE